VVVCVEEKWWCVCGVCVQAAGRLPPKMGGSGRPCTHARRLRLSAQSRRARESTGTRQLLLLLLAAAAAAAVSSCGGAAAFARVPLGASRWAAGPAVAYRPQRIRCDGVQDLAMGGGMGAKKKRFRTGSGEQRARWDGRGASSSAEQPQPQADRGAAGVDSTEERVAKLEALAARRFGGLIVVLEDIENAYNAGAALRSCEAFGVTEVWLVHNGIAEG